MDSSPYVELAVTPGSGGFDGGSPQALAGQVPGGEPVGRLLLRDEAAEGQAVVDVVDDRGSARAQARPGTAQLECRIAAGVQAVVHEDLDGAELVQQPGQLLAARALDIRPPRA